ncbi:MAG: tyrosine-type recombinase/integrase [Chloroflexota bacterium]
MKTQTIKAVAFRIDAAALRDAWTDFYLSRQVICTEATLRLYQKVLGEFITWLEENGIHEPNDITARTVRQYLTLYADKSSWYQNGIARQIRTLLRFWHSEGYMDRVTFELPKVRQKRLPFLTPDQVTRLLDVCDIREKAVICFMVDSGLRLSEVINLNRGDVDIHSGLVVVREGKGRKDRVTAIGVTTRRAVLKYWQTQSDTRDHAPCFQTTDGGRFTAMGLRSLMVRLSKRVGFKVTAHMLRRSFATISLQNGMNIVTIQGAMGHTSLETTRRYIQLLTDDLVKEHGRHSPIDNLRR